jgi:hypothetical protein
MPSHHASSARCTGTVRSQRLLAPAKSRKRGFLEPHGAATKAPLMRCFLQLGLMLLLLLGVGTRAWCKGVVGPQATAPGFAADLALRHGPDTPPALLASGAAAMWGYDVATAGSSLRDSTPATAGPVIVSIRHTTLGTCPSAPPPPSASGSTTNPAWVAVGPNIYAYVMQNPWTGWDPHGLLTVGEAGEFTYGMAKSYAGAVVSPFVAPYQSMLHPVDSATGLKNLVVHPVDSVNGAVQGVKDTWNSGPEGKGEIVMDGIIAVASVRQAFKGFRGGKGSGSSSPKAPVAEAPALEPSPSTPGGQSALATGEIAAAEAEAAAPPAANTTPRGRTRCARQATYRKRFCAAF